MTLFDRIWLFALFALIILGTRADPAPMINFGEDAAVGIEHLLCEQQQPRWKEDAVSRISFTP